MKRSTLLYFTACLLAIPFYGYAQQPTSGDVDGDGKVSIADVSTLIDILLNGDSTSSPSSADVDHDGIVNIADVSALIDIILNTHPTTDDHEYVDLGLPSGTLWATCNIGANSPEEYGDYFAWGETSPKESYTWGSYLWGYYDNYGNETLSKYNTKSFYGTVDNKTELEPVDDAAYVNWGSLWRTPNMAQQQELVLYCNWEWVSINTVYGALGIGPNGKTLFFPAAGYRYNSSLGNSGSYGAYWSRTLYDGSTRYAFFLYFAYSYYGDFNVGNGGRSHGHTVRAVRISQK